MGKLFATLYAVYGKCMCEAFFYQMFIAHTSIAALYYQDINYAHVSSLLPVILHATKNGTARVRSHQVPPCSVDWGRRVREEDWEEGVL